MKEVFRLFINITLLSHGTFIFVIKLVSHGTFFCNDVAIIWNVKHSVSK